MRPVKEIELPGILGHRRMSVSAAAALVASAVLMVGFVVMGIIKGFPILAFPILIACCIVGTSIALAIGPTLNRLIYGRHVDRDERKEYPR